jgi:hypothetical protein
MRYMTPTRSNRPTTLSIGERARVPLAVNVVEIGARQPRPTRLELDAYGAASEVACLDQRRADSAHGIDNEVAGLAVAFDRSPGERWKHLAGMPIGLGQIALVSLPLARALSARPNG